MPVSINSIVSSILHGYIISRSFMNILIIRVRPLLHFRSGEGWYSVRITPKPSHGLNASSSNSRLNDSTPLISRPWYVPLECPSIITTTIGFASPVAMRLSKIKFALPCTTHELREPPEPCWSTSSG